MAALGAVIPVVRSLKFPQLNSDVTDCEGIFLHAYLIAVAYEPIWGYRSCRAIGRVGLGHTFCTYSPDPGHADVSPGPRLTPVPGDQPVDLRSSPRSAFFGSWAQSPWVLACAVDHGCHGFGAVRLQGP